ncbi:MAG: LPP20 family lipoprotein [Chlamydiae bacterium]|nr:LPP20 family lipoprotein [Chlamydiota bacterium]MBI3277469.1 LPP20 family lipoprotein [Chlamydiota bacterium]
MISKFLFAFPIFSLMLCMRAEGQSQGKIKALQGSVKIIQQDKETPATLETIISPSDTLMTGPHSYCVVELDPNNMFRVKQNTEVKIAKIKSESHSPEGKVVIEYRLDLMRGTLTAKLNKLPPDSKFDISSPVAIAGATGTAYTVEVDPESQRTRVSVLDHEVLVQSVNEPGKSVKIQKFEEVNASPWSSTLIRAEGRGALSEAILGKSFIKEAEEKTEILSRGEGSSLEEAQTRSLHQLSKIVGQLHIDSKTTLDDRMNQDSALTQKVYELISHADQTQTSPQGSNESFQIISKLKLDAFSQALGFPLYGITQSILPISLAEYSNKFGALARVTTLRAAQVEGDRNLAEIIFETVISSHTTLEDFAVKNDTVRTTVQGVVKGAQVKDIQYFSDGSIIVSMELQGDGIPQSLQPMMGDVFGKNYLSSPRHIEFNKFEEEA